MTTQRSFKRLVRTRMEKTGESYTAARSALLGAQTPKGSQAPLATSDDEIRRRTGLGWEQWFDLLDGWGASERPHRDIARWVAERLGIDPLAWDAQAVTTSYERARGGRAVGQRADGFTVTASRTVAVPAERLYEAFVDAGARGAWLLDVELRERTATPSRSARFDVAGGGRLHVTLADKGDGRTTATVEHARLSGAAEAERMKAFWRERLASLKERLEEREPAA